MGRRIKSAETSRHVQGKVVCNRALPDSEADSSTRLKRYIQWQETVAVLGQIALASSDLQDLMSQSARRLAEVLEIDFVEVLELEGDGKSLILRAGHGWPGQLVGSARVKSASSSQAGFTLLVNEPVVVTDLKSERRFAAPPLLLNQGVVCGVTVTIGGRLQPYGVLGAHSRRFREFTADDIHFLRTVANVLATAVRGDDADRAQRDGAERVRAIVNTLVDGIITIDADGLIESLNPAAEKIFGYTALELVGRNVNVLMPEPYQAEHDGYLSNYLNTGLKRIIGIGREVAGKRKDGSIFPMDLAVSELRVSSKRMFTGVVRDITERRRMEREIIEAGAEEQRRIGQDLHDGLCQHLAGIAFATEVLSQKIAARSTSEAANINKVGTMIDQAITLARDLARGLQPVTLDAGGLVAALKALSANVEEMFHISCIFVCDGPCLVSDNNVATHLYRIAQEAISNAVKHGRARTVIVDLVVSERRISLTVSDDGIGLKPAKNGSKGMGLRTMDYRARVIGGTLRAQPGSKGGTTVVCIVETAMQRGGEPEGIGHGKETKVRRKTKNQNIGRGRSPNRP